MSDQVQFVEAEHIFGKEIVENPLHIDLIKRDLTRSLGILFPDVYDEITSAFNGQPFALGNDP
jgi:hypothetical protein